jgi:hypothetical protein
VSSAAGPTASVVAAAEAFLSSLSGEQRERALYDAGDPALRQWIYFPTTGDRNGVAFGDLSDEQRGAAFGVAEAVLRPMLAEAEAVAGLLDSLDEGELAASRIDPIDDVRVGTGASDRYPQAQGTLVTDLDADQQGRVLDAVRAWVGDTDERVAGPLLEQYRAEFARTRIAWTGSTDPDTPGSYLRIDGPRLWIEFSNVGRFGNGDNHYHSVYRDKQADYLG